VELNVCDWEEPGIRQPLNREMDLSGGVSSIAVDKTAAETGSSLAGVDRNFSSDGVSDTGERRLSASRLAKETTLIGEVSRVLSLRLLHTAGPVESWGGKAVGQCELAGKTTPWIAPGLLTMTYLPSRSGVGKPH
jgi:hypothetical protein